MLDQTANSRQTQGKCFHCGLPIGQHGFNEVVIDNVARAMCCPGCQAVAQAIVDAGLGDYYRFRDPDTPARPRALVPGDLQSTGIYDQDSIRSRYVHRAGSGSEEVTLMLDGLTCAACAWLVENQVKKLPGVEEIDVNYASMTARTRWSADKSTLGEILNAIRRIGYGAVPYEPRARYQQLKDERRRQIRRIGITAALGMQVMIISVALYFANQGGMDAQWKNLFYKVGLLLTLPVLLYSAQGFFTASARQLLSLQPGMDVPVSLGLLLAFTASAWTAITGQGEVYFDSVVMFVFFLLVARFIMHSARLTAGHGIERLATGIPLVALKLWEKTTTSRVQSIPAQELNPGDWIRVLAGHTLPADGVIIKGESSINQAVISGESRPVQAGIGNNVIAGSINIDHPLIVEVTASGDNTVLSGIETLAEQSLAGKTASTPLIDTIARWFVTGVLILALATGLYWWTVAPEKWLEITVAVLVVSCPCALSLAVPTAWSASNSRLLEKGLLLTGSQALEQLARVSHVVLDKTGTLTGSAIVLDHVQVVGELTQAQCLAIAAALELNSEHPTARAIVKSSLSSLPNVSSWQETPGKGVRGGVNGIDYVLGSAAFIEKHTGIKTPNVQSGIQAVLASTNGILAIFLFSSALREGAVELVGYFANLGKPVIMLTGDAPAPADKLARELNIGTVYSECKPRDKLDCVKRLQREEGATVLMIGDGINDSPVLAAADVSIAVAGASPLAVSGADVVMVNPSLAAIIDLHRQAGRTGRIVRQNIGWAVGYNLFALPFAAMGFVKPLFAAIGMSLSSLIVVLNALRLKK